MFSSAAASNGTPGPVGLTLVMGGSLYIQKAFWLGGTQPSAETVQAFKRAHAEACQAVGMDNVKVSAEQELFDTPMIWNLQAEDDPRVASPSYTSTFLCNATRLAVTTLSVADVQALAEVAAVLQPLTDYRPDVVAPILSDLPRAKSTEHKKELSQVLGFMLNIPHASDGFVFCANEGRCIIIASGLRLDQDKLSTLGTHVVSHPTAQQKCESRLVCFWCGISPLSMDVKLSCCGQCGCVAYCGPACQRLDWNAEHHRECKRTEQGMHANAKGTGVVSLPAIGLSITRVVTEAGKPTSLRAQVSEESDNLLSLRRICCASKEEGDVIPVPMAWELK